MKPAPERTEEVGVGDTAAEVTAGAVGEGEAAAIAGNLRTSRRGPWPLGAPLPIASPGPRFASRSRSSSFGPLPEPPPVPHLLQPLLAGGATVLLDHFPRRPVVQILSQQPPGARYPVRSRRRAEPPGPVLLAERLVQG